MASGSKRLDNAANNNQSKEQEEWQQEFETTALLTFKEGEREFRAAVTEGRLSGRHLFGIDATLFGLLAAFMLANPGRLREAGHPDEVFVMMVSASFYLACMLLFLWPGGNRASWPVRAQHALRVPLHIAAYCLATSLFIHHIKLPGMAVCSPLVKDYSALEALAAYLLWPAFFPVLAAIPLFMAIPLQIGTFLGLYFANGPECAMGQPICPRTEEQYQMLNTLASVMSAGLPTSFPVREELLDDVTCHNIMTHLKLSICMLLSFYATFYSEISTRKSYAVQIGRFHTAEELQRRKPRFWQLQRRIIEIRRSALPTNERSAQEPGETEEPEVPAVGWLWSKSKQTPITRQSLRQQNIRPKKSLGQNFMVDDTVLQAITTAANLSPGDPVLEIGPGTGALTRHLLSEGAHVTAVEKDYGLHDLLVEEYSEVPELRLVCGDVLRQDFGALLDEIDIAAAASSLEKIESADQPLENKKKKKIQVVANLPYYITKDFLLQAMPWGDRVSSLLLMVQEEVAVRLTQKVPGTPDWRAMNIILRYYCEPQYLFKIDRKKYVPAPKVHGAVVKFTLRSTAERPSVPCEKEFLMLVKKAFLQRRKVLRNALQPLVSSAEVAAALQAAGLPLDSRAQGLGLDDFVKLCWEIRKIRDAAPSSSSE